MLRTKVPDIEIQADGYTGEAYNEQLRKFFESNAYVWRVQYSDTKLDQFPEKDVHSHARLRVNGVVMNVRSLWGVPQLQTLPSQGKKGLYLVTQKRPFLSQRAISPLQGNVHGVYGGLTGLFPSAPPGNRG